MTSVGEFDKICVRSFLTLDASTLAGNSEGDILYSIIYEMVNVHVTLNHCILQVFDKLFHSCRFPAIMTFWIVFRLYQLNQRTQTCIVTFQGVYPLCCQVVLLKIHASLEDWKGRVRFTESFVGVNSLFLGPWLKAYTERIEMEE